MFLGEIGQAIADNSDLNDFIVAGMFYKFTHIDSVTNRPAWSAGTGEFVMQVQIYKYANEPYGVQTIKTNNSEVFLRVKKNTEWLPWVQVSIDIPSFYKSYTDLSSLATALGNAQTHHLREDADGLLSKGIYLADGSGTSYNAPSNYGILITDYAGSSGSYWYIQRFFRTDGNMYVRTKQGTGNWDSWYLFTGTVVQ